MKKRIALIIATVLLVSTMGVCVMAEDAGENPGQIIDNPWADPTTTSAETPTAIPPSVVPEDPTAVPVVRVPDKATVKKAVKKKSSKKIKITLKKAKGAKGYQVAVYKTKKNAKKTVKALKTTYTKKVKFSIKSKKFKKKKKLFVRARAYTFDGTQKLFGPWSKVKKVKIKK